MNAEMRRALVARVGIAPDVRAAWSGSAAAVVVCVLCLLAVNYNLTLGVLLLAGGEARIQTASFVVVRDFGGHLAWGLALIAVATIMVIGALRSGRTLAVSIALAALLHAAVGLGFIAAAIRLPDAALTGPPTYLLISAGHAVVAGYHWYCATGT